MLGEGHIMSCPYQPSPSMQLLKKENVAQSSPVKSKRMLLSVHGQRSKKGKVGVDFFASFPTLEHRA
jgi:hypothetical protein